MRFKFSNTLIILLIPTILIMIWFRQGSLMATGESGIPFYDLSLQYNINKSAWAAYALGHPTNISVAGAPTYYFLSLFQKAGIPPFIIQASFFWGVLVCSGFSVYFLTKYFFPEIQKKYLLLAVFFYWFNPFSLVNVWNRFLNNFLIFYALLPLLFLLFLKGIKAKQYIYSILIGLVSVIFSYASTSIAFDMLLWLILLYATFFHLIISKEKNKLFIVTFFSLTLLFWCLANFWWISQVFSYVTLGGFDLVTSKSFVAGDNHYTFNVLSERLGRIVDLLRLKHASFFADAERIYWVTIYQNPLLNFFEFLVTGIILFPIMIKRKHPNVLFLGGLFMLAIFFTKGNNPPFGEVFDKVFVNLSFFQVFRNPFEKIGFVLPLSAVSLFCLGVNLLIKGLSRKIANVVYFVILFWLIFVWGYPFWSGLVFTSADIPTSNSQIGYQVQVPNFYQKASDWLSSQGEDFRLTVFPIGGEGITNAWSKGYSGVELSNQLLPKTSVSFNTNIPFYDQVSRDLERILLTKTGFTRIMEMLNSKYLVIRSDIDWRARNMRDPQTINNRMENLGTLFKNVKNLGDLSFWQYLDWKDKTIYPAKSVVKVSGSPNIEDALQLDSEDVLLNGEESKLNENMIKSEIIHPSFKFELGRKRIYSDFSFTDDIIFPAVKLLPSDKIYLLILLKENIELALIRDTGGLLIKNISLLGKRLVEAEKEFDKDNPEGIHIALLSYNKKIKEILPKLSDAGLRINDKFLSQEELFRVFSKHIEIIDRFKTRYPDDKIIALSDATIKDVLIQKGILPNFGYIKKQSLPIASRIIYQFSIANFGEYELLLDAKSWDKYFRIVISEPMLFQIDENIVSRKAIVKENYISFGLFNFDAGKHEIAWNTPEEINLAEAPSEVTIKTGHETVTKSFDIRPFDPYAQYILNLSYFIKRGSGLKVSVEQNNDKYKKGEIDPGFIKYMSPDGYNFDIGQFSEYFVPYIGADSAKLVFKVEPWNNCKQVYKYSGIKKCNDQEVKQRFDLPTEVAIKDITLVKIMTEAPFLIKQNNYEFSSSLPRISYTKINAAEYKVKVEDAKNPFILVMSELFDPGWGVYISGDQQIDGMHFLANSYANGWIISKEGTYELGVKYKPQDVLRKGEIVSKFAIAIGVILLGFGLVRRYEKR